MHPALIFIAFGIVGWILDTAYRSATAGKYAPQTFLPGFSIVYAVGGLILYALHFTATLSTAGYVIVGTLLVTLMEFTAGEFCQSVLGKRYWDYSKNKFNLYGHIDALHTLYWIALIAILRITLDYLA